MSTPLVLLEDEEQLGLALEITLQKCGYQVTWFKNLEQAFAGWKQTNSRLFVIDRNLPDGDGIELCEKIRFYRPTAAILILSAIGETHARVQGLRSGADDYLAKPFSIEELQLRLKSLERRTPPAVDVAETPWELERDRLRIKGPKGWIELTPLEYKLAEKLILAKGNILTREQLLRDVWGFTLLPKTRTVDFFMGRLRRHFETTPDEPEHFLTVRGSGYRFEQ